MSTVTGAIGARRVAVRAALTDRVAVAGLGVLVVLLAALTWQTWGSIGGDTGYDFVAGSRVADGEIPYRDFPYFYGPLAPALAGLSAAIGGDGVAAFAGLGLVVTAAIVIATYYVARLAAGPAASAAAAAITAAIAFAPTNFSFVLPHTYSATLGLLGALLFLLGAGRYAAGGGIGWMWGAGAAAAAVALSRPEFAPAVMLAGAVWMALRWRSGTSSRRELLALALPAIGLPLIVYGAAMGLTSPSELLFENLYPVDMIDAGAGEVVSIGAPLTAGSFAEVIGRLVFYAAGAAAIVGAGVLMARSPGWRRAIVIGLAGVALAGLLVLAYRPEIVRNGLKFAYAWIALGAALAIVVLIWRYRHRGAQGWTAVAQAELLLAILLTVVAARTYAAVYAHASVAQKASYVIPLAAIFLAWLHGRELARSVAARRIGTAWLAFLALAGMTLAVIDARDQSAAVSGPGGTIAESPGAAASYQSALDEIARRTQPGDPILLAPQLTSLYALSERSNPLPQISLLPGALPDEDAERDAITTLDGSDVRLVIIDRDDLAEYGQAGFGQSYNLGLRDWLDRDFTRVATIDNDDEGTSVALDVWQRSTT